MSARGGGRWLRVALASIAALVVVSVYVVLRSGGGAAESRDEAREVAHDAPRESADVVLASSDEPRTAALAEAAPSDEPRRVATIGDTSGLRWGDVLRPVDALSGVSLTDVRVAHAPVALADLDDEPTWRALDELLESHDFAAPGFVVVDASAHVPALVELARALGADAPVDVPLSPSAAVRIDVIAEGAGTSLDQVLMLTLLREGGKTARWSPLQQLKGGRIDIEAVVRRDAPDGSVNFGARDVWSFAQWYASDLERIREDAQRSEQWRELTTSVDDRSATWDPPLCVGLHEDVRATELVTGLPAGCELTFQYRASRHVAFEPADPEAAFGERPAPIVLEPGELRVITLRLVGSADVIGALAGGATDGAVELGWLAADGTWIVCESRRELRGGEFRFDDVRPGAWRAAITWRDASGAHVRVARDFELHAGDTHDLGVLAPNDGVDVTIVPRVEIDGVLDETLLGGALLETSWRIDHSGASFDGTLESAQCARLEPLVLRGIVGDEFFVSFDRPELPKAAAKSLRLVEWRCATRHALAGPLTIEATLCLATSVIVPLELFTSRPSYPPSPRISVHARRVGTDEVREIDARFALHTMGSGFRVEPLAGLDLGTWDIFAAIGTQSPFEEDDRDVSWFGSLRIAVVPGAFARIELTRAATVIFGPNFDWRGDEPSGFFQVVPADQPDALAPLAYPWPGDGVTHDAAVDGLAPDTEYRVLGSEVRFRTGASGSRTLLE